MRRIVVPRLLRGAMPLLALALSGCPGASRVTVECRAKDAKVDVLWTAVDGAATYRVSRGASGLPPAPLADATGLVLEDAAVANGTPYVYVVTAFAPDGTALPATGTCSATPAVGAGRDLPEGPAAVSGLTCRAKDGKIDLGWDAAPGAYAYRIARSSDGGAPVVVGQSPIPSYADFQAVPGAPATYTVTALLAAGNEQSAPSLPCSVTPASPDGPAAVASLACRAKDGKVDLSWPAVAGASTYRVNRSGGGAPKQQIGETAGLAFADLALVNGVAYVFEVVTVDGRGRASVASPSCTATPGVHGAGAAPAPPTNLTCRGKNDKADLTWTGSQGAAFYRIFRTDGSAPAEVLAETTSTVLTTFGLQPGKSYGFTVESVGVSGTASAPSPVCSLAVSGRNPDGGNLPPRITSQPLTAALEDHFYTYPVAAGDPEGRSLTFALVKAPPGMSIDPQGGVVSWAPSQSLLGPHPVEIRATDPEGAYASQAFVVDVAAFDEPPVITSIPSLHARAGVPYRYDVDAFDPEGKPLVFGFAAPAPAGVTLDPSTGLVSWTPATTDAGAPVLSVRATDPAGGFATQTFQLSVTAVALDLLQPSGSFEIAPGDTLRLQLVANQAGAGFAVEPLPPNAKLTGPLFEFTPTSAQVGDYDLGFQALLGDERVLHPVTVHVRKSNRPPVLAPIDPQHLPEGGSLSLPVVATDPDGDAVRITAPGLSLPHALFDEVNSRLLFSPGFDQAGSYHVTIVASDGRESVQQDVAIVVDEAVPPVGSIDLVLDPVQSPTLAAKQTISGSTVGQVMTGTIAQTPFVVGLSPVAVRQGRSAVIEVTGLATDFTAGPVSPDFGEGVAVQKVEVLSATALRVTIGARTDAPLGARAVRVAQSTGDAASVVGFSVEPGSAQATGVLIDSFTQQPLAGVRVSILGAAGVSVVTDAAGHFSLDGVPAGEQTLVVTAPNYRVLSLPMTFQPNAPVNLAQDLPLDALARPFSAGGSLPRAATVASVLDRGVSAKDVPIDFEQARAVVQDTLLAIGGDRIGVTDAAGNQLNPNFAGPGFLSLTPAGIDLFARRLVKGDTYTLREIFSLLDGTLGWMFDGFTLDSVVTRMQGVIDLAWEKPSDPAAALILVLFNEGNTLDTQRPTVTPDTQFNSFQSFLLVSDFLIRNFTAIDDRVDDMLLKRGLDPSRVLAERGFDPRLIQGPPEPGLLRRTLLATARLGANLVAETLSGRPAFAQSGGGSGGSNKQIVPQRRGRALSAWDALNASNLVSAFISGVVGFAIAGLFAMCGLFGATLATFGVGAALAAFGVSFLSALLAKIYVAFLTADQAIDLAPKPASFQAGAASVDGQNKLRLRFQRSESETAKNLKLSQGSDYRGIFGEIGNVLSVQGIDPIYLDFRYHLWQLDDPSLQPTLGGPGTRLVSTRSLPVHGHPDQEQFVVPVERLQEGENYFRIVTVQFYRKIYNVDPDTTDVSTLYPSLGVQKPDPVLDNLTPRSVKQQYVQSSLGGIFKGSFEAPLGEAFDTYKARKEAAIQQALERARQQEIADRTQQIEDLRRLALAKKDIAQNLDAPLKTFDEQLLQLQAQKQAALADKTRLQSFLDWESGLQMHLADGANLDKSLPDLLQGLHDPSTSLGQETQRLLSKGVRAEQLDQLAESVWRLGRTQAAVAAIDDHVKTIDLTKQELKTRLQQAKATGAPAPVHNNVLEIPTLDRTVPPRLVEPDLFELPASIGPGDDKLVADTLAVLDAQRAGIRNQAARLRESASALRDQVSSVGFAAQRQVVEQGEESAIVAIQKQMDITLAQRRTVELEQQKAFDDARLAGRAEQEAVDKFKADFPDKPPVIKPAAGPTNSYRGKTASAYLRYEGIDSTLPGQRYKWKPGVGDLFGHAVDVGTEAFNARDGILILRSDASAPIVVTKTNGQVSIPAPDSITLAMARPEEIGSPEVLAPARERLAPPQRPVVLRDDGLPAGADPLRWRRLRDALRRGGFLPQTVQSAGSGGFPPSFETDPDPDKPLAILHPTPPSGPTGKAGYLVRDYPFTSPQAEIIDAGFPSNLIAVDSQGAVYLENLNSNESYGGRIFRYLGDPIARDLVGAAAYYSLQLQYARPTMPVAMEVAEGFDPSFGVVEDVFLAELDPGVYLDPGIPATNKILRVATHQADLLPFYAGGQNRNRLVGQPYATHPDFQMTGPSDLERDTHARGTTDTSVPKNLYFSDEENVFAISDKDKDGQGEVAKVVSLSGRRWSGLAVDHAGNLLFADYASGDLYALPSAELDTILLTGVPITSEAELDRRAYLIKVGLNAPGDVEFDTWEQRYFVSTRDGFQAFDVPLVGRLTDSVAEIRVDVTGRELPVTLRRDRGGVFIVGSGSEDIFHKTVRIRVRRVDPATGASAWESREYAAGGFGVSVVQDPL